MYWTIIPHISHITHLCILTSPSFPLFHLRPSFLSFPPSFSCRDFFRHSYSCIVCIFLLPLILLPFCLFIFLLIPFERDVFVIYHDHHHHPPPPHLSLKFPHPSFYFLYSTFFSSPFSWSYHSLLLPTRKNLIHPFISSIVLEIVEHIPEEQSRYSKIKTK